MLAEMPGLESDWRHIIRGRLALGIGINTGFAQVGNTGSTRKFKYGPHGHTVNLASRVQELSKHLKTPLVITAETRNRLRPDFPARRLGRVHLAGMANPVEVHELPPAADSADWPAYRDIYERALAMYEAGQLDEAHQTLLSLRQTWRTDDSDTPLKLLTERVRECLNNPPAPFDPALYRTSH